MKRGPTTFYFSPIDKVKVRKDKKTLEKNGYFGEIIYNKAPSIQKLVRNAKSGDTIELHGDGIPWTTGGVYFNDKVDLNPFSLATLISDNFTDKNITLTIDLRFCTSGVTATGLVDFCFAQDLSKALYTLGYRNISVYGYSGYINAQKGFKESVCETGDDTVHGSKVKHCTLEEGRLIYQHDGELTQPAQKTLVEEFSYDQAEVEKDKTLKSYLDSRRAWFSPVASASVASVVPVTPAVTTTLVASDSDSGSEVDESYLGDFVSFTPSYSSDEEKVEKAPEDELAEVLLKEEESLQMEKFLP